MNEIVNETFNSGAAAGSGSCTVVFGSGEYEILVLSVDAGLTTDRAQSVNIRSRQKLPDATYFQNSLGSGFFSPNHPFMIKSVMFKGPGDITTFAFHLDVTSHNLNISYRRTK